MVNILCHEFVVAVSSVACILGLMLLRDCQAYEDEMEETEQTLVENELFLLASLLCRFWHRENAFT